MKKTLRIVLFSLVIFSFGCTISMPNPSQVHPLIEKKLEGEGNSKILVIEISGAISQSDRIKDIQGRYHVNMVARVKEELSLAEKDQNIKAIILKINSPGGEVTASDLIYHELGSFKKRKNIPIISHIVSIGASGAYYISMASDKIVAQPTAILGSIGVIMSSVNFHRLLAKIGVEGVTFKSGKFKDMGSPIKPPVEAESRLFQGMVNHLYNQFVGIVAKGRKMDESRIRELADGRIFTSTQAKKSGLIDQIGYFEDSVAQAKKEANLTSASIVVYNRLHAYRTNVYNTYDHDLNVSFLGLSLNSQSLAYQPKFLYLWTP